MPAFLLPLVAVFSAIPAAVWKWIGIGIAVGALCLYVDLKATHRADAKCEAAAITAQNAATAQDLEAEKQAHAADNQIKDTLSKQTTDDENAIADLKKQLDDQQAAYEAKLAAVKPGTCPTAPSCVYDGDEENYKGASPVPAPRPNPVRKFFQKRPAAGASHPKHS